MALNGVSRSSPIGSSGVQVVSSRVYREVTAKETTATSSSSGTNAGTGDPSTGIVVETVPEGTEGTTPSTKVSELRAEADPDG